MNDPIKILSRLFVFIFAASIFITACSTSTPTKVSSEVVIATSITQAAIPSTIQKLDIITKATWTPSQTMEPSKTARPTATPTLTSSSTTTATITPTLTTPSLTPTYSILRGTVLEQANCRYGPGAAYLYKYGLYAGNNLEIIGRNETGTWIVIRAIGGTNPCWVKASLLNIKGDVMSLALTSLPLPQSPYYGPLTGANAQRSGDSVVISWNPMVLRAGDDSLQFPYLIEAWLCKAGNLVFTPIGSWETIVTVQDESGCSEPSHARVYGVEKHGYTNWVEVPWPPP